MKICLSPRVRIREVKKLFNREFPYLRLEFVLKKDAVDRGIQKDELVSGHLSLADISPFMKSGQIHIMGSQTIAGLEQLFQNKFGLAVQVFRKGKNAWIEITKTNYLTLSRQNRMGRKSSNAIYDEVVLL